MDFRSGSRDEFLLMCLSSLFIIYDTKKCNAKSLFSSSFGNSCVRTDYLGFLLAVTVRKPTYLLQFAASRAKGPIEAIVL